MKKFAFSLLLFLLLPLMGCRSATEQTDSTGYTPNLSSEYLVTQYPDASGVQGVCYTIENDSFFLIIDGGWADNADALRQIIASHDNHVDAWIISHPHQDHAGAFNQILSDPQGITIDRIFDNGFDYDFIESVGEPYDDITVMETYHTLTAGLSNVTHLKRGDVLTICGLTFTILNSYDDTVLYTVGDEQDYQNNASLLFLVASENSKILFCSDIKYDMDAYLTESCGDMIACDYVQAGHHGNWSFSDEFYQKTGASVFFIDAPEAITDNPDFPASELKSALQAQNKTVLDFSTAPNTVTLK
jgi:beta-lactamase superfamily II metal-dependent hydrolase